MLNRSILAPAGGIAGSVLAGCLLPACGHTDPVTPPPYETSAPFDPSPPQRLTYNTAADRGPAWLPDGSGLVYSTQLVDRPDRDVCLALLPPAGGSQRGLWCDVPEGEARNHAVESAAPAPDGGIAFVSAAGTIGGTSPIEVGIFRGPTLDPRRAAMVRTFPVTPAGSAPQDAAEHLRWLEDGRLAYLAEQFRARAPCAQCAPDTLRIGLVVMLLDAGTPGAAPLVVPGTGSATGVATEAGLDAVYYTLGGDSRVYRRMLGSGVVEVVHDFGAAGVARDIHIAGRRLAAVVGGRASFGTDPQFGPMQWDSGGALHVVDLNSGEDTALDPGARLYRRPALAPSGNALAAEGYPLIIVEVPTAPGFPPAFDTTVAKAGDLFLYGAP